ncbi:hypothetical protein [Halobacillus salinus]|uniref:Uncharacterized protein n=1 Tax=Halobacillus salinus TaxID=192814 RepID=A0A4Z0H268_9BACI|nr:hypothetical protein [Halobacillus salinus]TGB03496.1 hypothetical protein E4663_00365 [Halobacillus salinus]
MSDEANLSERLRPFIEGEDPLVQKMITHTLDEVSRKSLSVDAISKKMSRRLDQWMREEEEGRS